MENKLAKKRGRGMLGRHRGQDPFHELQREMNQLFNGWMDPIGNLHEISGQFVPTIDVTDDEKEVRVLAELPGMNEEDIEVIVSDSLLTIQGEKKKEQEEEHKGYYYKESSYGSFRRVIDLPSEVDEDKVKAEFKNGVLKINLPKAAAAQSKAKKIQIKPAKS